MKVKELAGKINICYLLYPTKFRFVDFKSHCFISDKLSIHTAFAYWRDFSVISYAIDYDGAVNTILIDVIIDPDERKKTQ